VEGKFLVITISNLTKNYGGKVQALRGVDLEIGTGMFGLVGPNGAGKTTLMRILAGLLRPSSGMVTVFGNDPTTTRGKLAVKSMLGYIPQELGLYPDLTALEFLEYVALLKGITDPVVRKTQLAEVLEQVGLTSDSKRRMRTFSGGMKRRVGIAQAMLGSPQLLIVDEPTAGLDPEERVRLRNLLFDMASHCTVILSTHIVEDISQSCNDMAVINLGQVLFRGSPREVIANVRGKVWNVTTDGTRPGKGVEIVSSMQTQAGVQYRLVGGQVEGLQAIACEPSLEDGYIWLMQQARANQHSDG
jgi:ABC-2 type transport system ATP-binding protein